MLTDYSTIVTTLHKVSSITFPRQANKLHFNEIALVRNFPEKIIAEH